jgi:hypothetical protein
MEVVRPLSLAAGALPQTRQCDPPVPIVPRSWDLGITFNGGDASSGLLIDFELPRI